MIEGAHGAGAQRMAFQRDSDKPPSADAPTLNEIQIRAYRIHQQRGAVYGGYTLDDWLEAERKLNEQLRGNRNKEEQVH
jgi:Protein of unknown function (DUF2934)